MPHQPQLRGQLQQHRGQAQGLQLPPQQALQALQVRQLHEDPFDHDQVDVKGVLFGRDRLRFQGHHRQTVRTEFNRHGSAAKEPSTDDHSSSV